MATINYFLWSKQKGRLAPIYVRLSAGRGTDVIVKTELNIKPEEWSSETQTIKQRKVTKESQKLKDDLIDLKKHIEHELNSYFGELSKTWLSEVIYRFHNKKSSDAETLMEYIERFIKEAEQGKRKKANMMNIAEGTLHNLRGLKAQLTNYQVKRTQERKRTIMVDFENVNIDFYNDFVSYLSDEGYAQNTIGKHIRVLKMFMNRSLEEKLHNNRDFQFRSFKGISRKSFNIYLNDLELDELYKKNLTAFPDLDKARDAFLTLCETGLRVSDYRKIDVRIRTDETGARLIYLTQEKTGGEVVIPVSARLQQILDKYNGILPKVRDQYINRDIKKVAKMCGINDVIWWTETKLGKSYERTSQKWKKISCHTGRRTACTNMYLAGIPVISIMQVSGHKSESSFLNYIKLTQEENARKLATHPYFTKLRAI